MKVNEHKLPPRCQFSLKDIEPCPKLGAFTCWEFGPRGAKSCLRSDVLQLYYPELTDRFVAALGWSLAVILTKSATELAFIFCITWPRCAFTVLSVMPSSTATCLFNRPETTNAMTSRSRGVSEA